MQIWLGTRGVEVNVSGFCGNQSYRRWAQVASFMFLKIPVMSPVKRSKKIIMEGLVGGGDRRLNSHVTMCLPPRQREVYKNASTQDC